MTTEIQQLLKERIGLDAASVGRLVIDQIIRGRMAARGVGEACDYYQQLCSDDCEMRELIERARVGDLVELAPALSYHATAT